jgi:pteridine reductase
VRPIALVTGGTRRVGRAIVLELARCGFEVVATWRSDRDGAERVASEVAAAGGVCRTLELDLAQDDPARVVRAAGLSRLDALVLNAAAWRAGSWGSIRAVDAVADFRANALGPVLLAQGVAPMLQASSLPGGGSLVAVGDAHADATPVRGYASYLMSKAALHQAVRQMAVELAPSVRVNGVLPGVVAWPEDMPEERREAIVSRIPLSRAGAPEDVARLVRFLCLEAPFMTGALVPVDGGRSIR